MTLLDVAPRSASHDPADRAAGYPEGAPDDWQRLPSLPSYSDGAYGVRRQDSMRMILAEPMWRLRPSTFGLFVSHVVSVGSDDVAINEAFLDGRQVSMADQARRGLALDDAEAGARPLRNRRTSAATTSAQSEGFHRPSFYQFIRDSAGNSAASNVATIAAAQPTVSTGGNPPRTTVTPAEPNHA